MTAASKIRPGVVTGKALSDLYARCKELECALPAVNVVGSHGVNAALAAAREAKAPVIVQLSQGGAQFYGGKFLDNSAQEASIAGSIAAAHHVRVMAEYYGVPVVLHTDHCAKKLMPWVEGLIKAGEEYYEKHGAPLYSSHMLDLSEEPLEENIKICEGVLSRLSKIDMQLEMELGVTGGEEDGVDNSAVDNARLYTQPSEVLQAFDRLSKVGAFSIAASFGNTHGVYKPGNVVLRPVILKNSQELIAKERKTADAKPVNFVFHGGSGSSQEEIREAVSYGVIKMNIDTDTQWAFTHPIRKYMEDKSAYLQSQIGNPDGPDKPNKKQIDPRAWLHLGEKEMCARLITAFKDLNSFGKFG
ncbi:MAG: class II fructose-bisphosphate aldolase [Polyangiaceae bacterium]